MTGPLSGKTVIVTRPAEDTASLADMLQQEGATVLVAPAIEIEPVPQTSDLDRALRELADGGFEWVSFSSPRAVDVVAGRLDALGLGRSFKASIAAVGPATSDRVRRAGWTVALVADPHTTLALGEAFPNGAGRVLLPRADVAPEGLERRLAAKGWTPVRVDAYRTRIPDALPRDVAVALEAGAVDAVVFTSASTARGFASMAGVTDAPPAVCIGPVTADAARAAGFVVAAVANPHTVEGVVEAVRSMLAGAAR